MKLRWFFLFFFVSGLCSLVYEVIWLRLAMARFGVTTPLISIFLSLFMAGLGLGSWFFGKFARRQEDDVAFSPLRWYATTELLIGCSAFAVPVQMDVARNLLSHYTLSLTSNVFYLWAGLLLAIVLLPWSTCMGATFPFALAAIRRLRHDERSFSFLYLANVLGAILGALLPPFVLVELLGFRGALHLTAFLNFFIAVTALALSARRQIALPVAQSNGNEASFAPASLPLPARSMLAVLFLTGLATMAMEVVWIRQYTPFLGTAVYAFALILAFYLAGTFAGSQIYRRWSRQHAFHQGAFAWLFLGVASLLPLLAADPRFSDPRLAVHFYTRLGVGLLPFTGLVGFLTPMVVDNYSGGDPDRAGSAYAVNVLGCLVGPLLSGFILVPWFGERWSLVLLAIPLFVLVPLLRPAGADASHFRSLRRRALAYSALLTAALLGFTKDFEQMFSPRLVGRDYAATVIAAGEGMNKMLIMNGQNLTVLSPVTKMMAHLPLAMLGHPPQNALVICFGMGTTHRSLLSWGIHATAVELLPSVPKLYGYYHPDGPQLLKSPRSTVIVDDGRMFLEHTSESFDVITEDPPPPIEAAGVSLLYSEEFYELVKRRLKSGGIFQQWTSHADATDIAAIARALHQVFPYVRAYVAFDPRVDGIHFLCSMSPLPDSTPAELAARLTGSAPADLVEWGPSPTPEGQFTLVLGRELSMEKLMDLVPGSGPLHDERPVNEYYFLRYVLPARWQQPVFQAAATWRHYLD